MDTYSFIIHVKTDDIYKDIADFITRFDTSNCDIDRPLTKKKNSTLIGIMKD